MAKIKISDVNKKHFRIIGYLVVSAILAYVLSVVVNKPEAVYLAPVINYVIYALAEELKKEGYFQALKNK